MSEARPKTAAEGLMDARTPRPDPRLKVWGAVSAAAVAAAAYVVALSVDLLPPPSVAVAMFVQTPVFALLALVVVWSRRHESTRPDLSWFATGLLVAVLAMVLQVISFPSVYAGGGPLHTSQTSNAALYLVFHLAAALGALLGAWGAPRPWRAWFLTVGASVAVAVALDLVPLPELITPEGRFTDVLIGIEVVLVVVIATSVAAWLLRTGPTARPLVALVGVSQSLAVYDVVLNALASERFSAIWWSSLSMRVATYGLLALGSAVAVLVRLRGLERYASEELDRREAQLRESLTTVQRLLDQATENAATLQEKLLPRELSPPSTVQLAARYAGAGPDKQIGGDWYDAISLPDGGLALVIGDIEGHDLAAAAVMGQVRAAVHSYALEGHPPAILLERVNQFLLGSGIDRFVALAYVQLYPGDRMMTIAVAGNPSPVVVPHDGGPPRAVQVEVGPPLGLDAGYAWHERTMLLPPATDLALVTDGVFGKSPWEGAHGEAFPDLLPARSDQGPGFVDCLADALIAAVTEDDAAVLAARVVVDRHTAAERALPVRPISSPIARGWLADLIEVWIAGGDLCDSPRLRDKVETALLLSTELVSNALRHGEDTIRVRAELAGTRLRFDVVDTSHRMPAMQTIDGTETSGRGLRLVEGLSDDWGVHLQDRGKSVWFSLDLEGEAPSEDELLAAFDLDFDLDLDLDSDVDSGLGSGAD